MADFTYGDYVKFNNITDIPNEHHHHSMLNQISDVYITSLSKLIDDIFE